MKVSGREIADRILTRLKQEIVAKKLKASLAIILAGEDPASEIYVSYKLKVAKEIGIEANVFRFSSGQFKECTQKISALNLDDTVSGIIIQYPVFTNWNFEELLHQVSTNKDVDGFLSNSPFLGATALGIWEMLREFANIEGFSKTEDFLTGKRVVLIGKGRAAGKPTMQLLESKHISYMLVDSKTNNPDQIIKSADVVISASGQKNIVNGHNIKAGSYIIGVGVGREEIAGEQKTFGDINEEEISQKAKLYCPTIGGIGPLTIACLLKNVVNAACLFENKKVKSPHGLHG